MNISKMATFAAIALSVAAATGCIQTDKRMMPGGIVAATKPVEQGRYTVLNGGKSVSGKYTMDILNSSQNDISGSAMKKACDQALAQCPGADALVDVKTDTLQITKMLRFPPFPLEMTYTTFVTGVPVKTNE